MKIRICYTINVGNRLRRAINHHYGKPGLASREEIRSFYIMYGESVDADILYDLEQAELGDSTDRGES